MRKFNIFTTNADISCCKKGFHIFNKIGFCCYNVGEEVYQKLSETVNNFSGLYEIRQGNIYVDLKNINRKQLEEIGVNKIDVCPYCTVCNNDLFFSYRKENATPYRHSAVIKLR